jgi:hypothetical protein
MLLLLLLLACPARLHAEAATFGAHAAVADTNPLDTMTRIFTHSRQCICCTHGCAFEKTRQLCACYVPVAKLRLVERNVFFVVAVSDSAAAYASEPCLSKQMFFLS